MVGTVNRLLSLAFWGAVAATATGITALFVLIRGGQKDLVFVSVLAVLALAELIPLVVHIARKYR
jgi:hypothetical protein